VRAAYQDYIGVTAIQPLARVGLRSDRSDRVGVAGVDQVWQADTQNFVIPVVVGKDQATVGGSASRSVDVANSQLILERIKGRLKIIGELIQDVWYLARVGMII
jgi:hypothetical protein